MEVRIDSPDPETHAGEIVCRGMNMMLGYYKNPEATAQIIDANGCIPVTSARWMKKVT